MKKLSSSISLLLIISSFSITFSAQKLTCNPQDLITLRKINAALGIRNPPGDCCRNWTFVVCDVHPPYEVTQLNHIKNPNISGQIPAAISNLKSLEQILFINIPNLTGNIPPEITKLSFLSSLTISHTGLSGQIPTFLKNVDHLFSLDLSHNFLTVSIPPELSQSHSLQALDLSGNKLTGTIPESFGFFKSKFAFLVLSSNNLTGPILKSLGNMNLKRIDLSRNNFSGDASFLFNKNKTLIYQQVHLEENNFTFNLSNLVFPKLLLELNLSHNNIFGNIPQQLTTEFSLAVFDVSYNKLCGEIPQGGVLQSLLFGIDSYIHNKCLCGSPLPACK